MDSFDFIGHQMMVNAAPNKTDAKQYIQNNVDDNAIKTNLNMQADFIHQ
tara:strand:+ start:3615 stop:3761 length:147 start_codon:yes stop_codon:yes gene_type:complete